MGEEALVTLLEGPCSRLLSCTRRYFSRIDTSRCITWWSHLPVFVGSWLCGDTLRKMFFSWS